MKFGTTIPYLKKIQIYTGKVIDLLISVKPSMFSAIFSYYGHIFMASATNFITGLKLLLKFGNSKISIREVVFARI